MKYKTERVYYPSGDMTRYRVINAKGQWIAECKSQKMADRVRNGMILEHEETQKMKNFKL